MSLVNIVYNDGIEICSVDNVLKIHLIDDNRMPQKDWFKLLSKSKQFEEYNKPIENKHLFNFGLDEITLKNEIVSFNITLKVGENICNYNEIELESCLKQAILLYPGNYLVPFLRCYYKFAILGENKHPEFEINSNFLAIKNHIKTDKERNYSYLWKSILYILILNYNESITMLESINMDGSCPNLSNIVNVLIASNLSFLARDDYERQNFTEHNNKRDRADILYEKSLKAFLNENYFTFIKHGVLYAYRQNCKHNKKNNEFIQFKVVGPNYNMFKDTYLYTNQPRPNQFKRYEKFQRHW